MRLAALAAGLVRNRLSVVLFMANLITGQDICRSSWGEQPYRTRFVPVTGPACAACLQTCRRLSPSTGVAVGTTSGAGRFGGSSGLSFDAGRFASGAPTSLFDVPPDGYPCERAVRCEGSFQVDESGEGPYGRLRLSSLTFSMASVPEPSTWRTMVLGFGLAGAAMRRDGPA